MAGQIVTYDPDTTSPDWIRSLNATGVSGSRDFRSPALVANWVRSFPGNLIVGDAGGVDTIVSSVAEADSRTRTVLVVPFRKSAGRAGGLLRNPDVVRWARAVVCFWSGEINHAHPDGMIPSIGSTGTAHAGFWALVYAKPLTIYTPDGFYVTMRPERGRMSAPPATQKGGSEEPPSLRPPDPPSPDGKRLHLRPGALPFV